MKLFKSKWDNIKFNKVKSIEQKGKGSYHKSSEKNNYMELLTDGWDTKIKVLEGKLINA